MFEPTLTSEANALEVAGISSGFVEIALAYLGFLALISSKDISSAGCIILLDAFAETIVFILLSLLLLPAELFVVGGALIVATAKKLQNIKLLIIILN